MTDDGKVIKFRPVLTDKAPPEDDWLVYSCGACGCEDFNLLVRGYVICAECETWLSNIGVGEFDE